MRTSSHKNQTLWLFTRSPDAEKAWLVQAWNCANQSLDMSSEPVQVAMSTSGLQRFASKLAKSQPCVVALKIASPHLLPSDDTRIDRWQVCVSGQANSPLIFQAEMRDLAELRLLKSAGLKPLVVYDASALRNSSNREIPATQAGEGDGTRSTSEPLLTYALHLAKGKAALSAGGLRTSHFLPSKRDWLMSLFLAAICFFSEASPEGLASAVHGWFASDNALPAPVTGRPAAKDNNSLEQLQQSCRAPPPPNPAASRHATPHPAHAEGD